MDGRSARARTKPATIGGAALREPPWWAISIGGGCVMTLLQSRGMLRIFRAVLTAVAARTILGAPEATVCSIVLPPSRAGFGISRVLGSAAPQSARRIGTA